jgi:hypothetical protein
MEEQQTKQENSTNTYNKVHKNKGCRVNTQQPLNYESYELV